MSETIEVLNVILRIVQVLVIPVVGYIAWAFRDLGTRISAVETNVATLRQRMDDKDVKCMERLAATTKLFEKVDAVEANTNRILGILEASLLKKGGAR